MVRSLFYAVRAGHTKNGSTMGVNLRGSVYKVDWIVCEVQYVERSQEEEEE